jgi:hypothetical protein
VHPSLAADGKIDERQDGGSAVVQLDGLESAWQTPAEVETHWDLMADQERRKRARLGILLDERVDQTITARDVRLAQCFQAVGELPQTMGELL